MPGALLGQQLLVQLRFPVSAVKLKDINDI